MQSCTKPRILAKKNEHFLFEGTFAGGTVAGATKDFGAKKADRLMD